MSLYICFLFCDDAYFKYSTTTQFKYRVCNIDSPLAASLTVSDDMGPCIDKTNYVCIRPNSSSFSMYIFLFFLFQSPSPPPWQLLVERCLVFMFWKLLLTLQSPAASAINWQENIEEDASLGEKSVLYTGTFLSYSKRLVDHHHIYLKYLTHPWLFQPP